MNIIGTLTRAELSESIHQRIGLSKAECQSLVESILDRMSDSLASGELVKIAGFGTFQVRQKAARTGRNPKTGVEVPIAPRRVLTFRASQKMRDRINQAG
ncbi:MAG: integration host factor subunit alpha [Sphingomonadales bacterium]|jgi:integration host factor subunit alpha|nr:integration host factor subunit alpha [Sphingomonadales bacterium]